jgi:NAD(P)-dependent dehydrogenase (short-subunit alcohol dehydrogenase family)
MSTTTRTAIVTGGAQGIGRAIVARLARDGIQVVIADRNEEAAKQTAAGIAGAGKDSVTALEVDVSDRSSVEAMVASAIEQLGSVDILVNNAGIMDRASFLDMDDDFWQRVLGTNLGGAFRCGQAVARHMAERGKGGRIVNVASNSGIFGGRGRAAYGASKAGIINLTQTMAIELAEYNILVNAVAPGPTKTKADQPDEPWPSVAMRMPLKRYGRPEEIAEVAAFLASPACSFTTGHVISADGGFTISGIMEG